MQPWPYEAKCVRMLKLLGEEKAARFLDLDTWLFEPRVARAMGVAAVDKFYENGLKHVGDLAGADRALIVARCGLSELEARRMDRLMRAYGLDYQADVSDWVKYRNLVGGRFRLWDVSRLRSQAQAEVRESYAQRARQHQRHT